MERILKYVCLSLEGESIPTKSPVPFFDLMIKSVYNMTFTST
jgi:hypothetical protein